MPLNTKTIKRRIKSVGSTKKITRAMEMISAVKMRKAVVNVNASRAYANLAWDMLCDIAAKTDIKHHPLLARHEVKKIGLIFVTSNRGLSGGFTSRLLQEAHKYINSARLENKETEIILMGKRGASLYTRFGHRIASEFDKLDLTASVQDILPLAQIIINDYINKKYDQVSIAFTDFVSPVKLVPRVKQLLPIVSSESRTISSVIPASDQAGYGFKYEPNIKQALDNLLPRLIEMQIYQAILESDASEHSARMMAMKNASEAAEDMISELQHSFNKARQASITQEISEIVGGVAALA